jgi:hypothetical protein
MEKKWNITTNVYRSDISVDEYLNCIRIFEVLRTKYPNDELFDEVIEVLREEICNMFGGTIYRSELE